VPYKASEKNELNDSSSCFEATELPATLRYPTSLNRLRLSTAVVFPYSLGFPGDPQACAGETGDTRPCQL
jgi:hypothetical protein